MASFSMFHNERTTCWGVEHPHPILWSCFGRWNLHWAPSRKPCFIEFPCVWLLFLICCLFLQVDGIGLKLQPPPLLRTSNSILTVWLFFLSHRLLSEFEEDIICSPFEKKTRSTIASRYYIRYMIHPFKGTSSKKYRGIESLKHLVYFNENSKGFCVFVAAPT